MKFAKVLPAMPLLLFYLRVQAMHQKWKTKRNKWPPLL